MYPLTHLHLNFMHSLRNPNYLDELVVPPGYIGCGSMQNGHKVISIDLHQAVNICPVQWQP